MKQAFKVLLVAAAVTSSLSAQASHIFATNPSINGVALESVGGFIHLTINAVEGDDLVVLLGIFGSAGSWSINFSRTSGSITLSNFGLNSAAAAPGSPNYYTFTQDLLAAGTWTGFLEPVSQESCPSYRYANGVLGGGGCGSPSESIPFTLNVAAASSAVPVPGSLALVGLGLLGFAARRTLQKKI